MMLKYTFCVLLSLYLASFSTAVVTGKWFDYIFIIQFENHSYDEVIQDPNFTKYRNLGTIFTQYYAITHPSQPNYWCQVAGDYFNTNSDGLFNWPDSNLADLMDAKKLPGNLIMKIIQVHALQGKFKANIIESTIHSYPLTILEIMQQDVLT